MCVVLSMMSGTGFNRGLLLIGGLSHKLLALLLRFCLLLGSSVFAESLLVGGGSAGGGSPGTLNLGDLLVPSLGVLFLALVVPISLSRAHLLFLPSSTSTTDLVSTVGSLPSHLSGSSGRIL